MVGNYVKKMFLLTISFISVAFWAMFSSNAVYDPWV